MVKKSPLRPLSDQVVIQVHDHESVTPGGIHIPELAQKHPWMGTVLAVGPGLRLADGTRADMETCVGDKVRFKEYAGQIIEGKDKGASIRVLREHEILGVVE